MARTKRSENLDTRTKRLALPLGARKMETLGDGRYLIYFRPMNGASGTWYARWRDLRTGKMPQEKIGMTFHELRHTYASMLLNAGVPLVFVSDQLGHKNTVMVERHYGHLCKSAKAETIRKLMPPRGFTIPNVAELDIKNA